jgi:hypothetical protein
MTKPLALLALTTLATVSAAQSAVAYSHGYLVRPDWSGGASHYDNRVGTGASSSASGAAGTASGSAWGHSLAMHAQASVSAEGVSRAQGFGRLTVSDGLTIASQHYTGSRTIRLGYSLSGVVNGSFSNPIDGDEYGYGTIAE